MKIFGCSDLHLDINPLARHQARLSPDGLYDTASPPGELWVSDNKPLFENHKLDVLLIAGDSAEVRSFQDKEDGSRSSSYTDFAAICAAYGTVVMVFGNHEYYHGVIGESEDEFRSIVKDITNLTFLENETLLVDHGDGQRVSIIGTMLWTDMNKSDPVVMWDVRRALNDYVHIKIQDNGPYARRESQTFQPLDAVRLYEQNRKFLVDEIGKVDSDGEIPVIVMTHMAPMMAHASPQRYGNRNVDYAYAASDLEDVIVESSDKIAVWFHGHTHDYKVTAVANTVVATKARGYDILSFDPLLLLDTDTENKHDIF